MLFLANFGHFHSGFFLRFFILWFHVYFLSTSHVPLFCTTQLIFFFKCVQLQFIFFSPSLLLYLTSRCFCFSLLQFFFYFNELVYERMFNETYKSSKNVVFNLLKRDTALENTMCTYFFFYCLLMKWSLLIFFYDVIRLAILWKLQVLKTTTFVKRSTSYLTSIFIVCAEEYEMNHNVQLHDLVWWGECINGKKLNAVSFIVLMFLHDPLQGCAQTIYFFYFYYTISLNQITTKIQFNEPMVKQNFYIQK